MAQNPPLYDLVLLLDTRVEADVRKQVFADAKKLVEDAGEIVSEHDWGLRTLAYEIEKRTEAEYHLIQFHGPSTLLEQLDRTLRIADGVLRHRIVKLAPGTPAPPDLSAAATAAAEAAAPEGDEEHAAA